MRNENFISFIARKRAQPEWCWARTQKEQPKPDMRDGVKVYPPMFAEGYFESDLPFVQGG
jgi:hypothetical protein